MQSPTVLDSRDTVPRAMEEARRLLGVGVPVPVFWLEGFCDSKEIHVVEIRDSSVSKAPLAFVHFDSLGNATKACGPCDLGSDFDECTDCRFNKTSLEGE